MRRALTRKSGRARRGAQSQNGAGFGAPDVLDAQIDDLLAKVEAENAVVWEPPPARRRPRTRRRPPRRLGARIRYLWKWKRTTMFFAATLVVSTCIAVATVYLATQALGG